MTNKVYLSPLDTERFGIVSARADDVRAADLPTVISFCRRHQVRFLIARCAADDFAAIHALETAGFLLMDTLVWYEHILNETDAQTDPAIRLAQPKDAAALHEVAQAAFAGYRGHYHADPRLPRQACDDLYADWTVRSLKDSAADAVLIAEESQKLVGFATLKKVAAQTVDLRLYGVHPAAQKQGWGGRLVQAAFAWALRRSATRLTTSTQIVNIRSQRVWQRQAFRTFAAEYTFHKWFDEVA